MSLQQKLDDTVTYFNDNLPAEATKLLQDTLDAGIARHIADNVLKVGAEVEEFKLPASTGETFSFTEKLKEGPIVLMFYRGSWCPFCNLTLKAYQDVLPEIQDSGASLLTVTPEYPEKAQETITKEGFKFDVVTDEHNQLAEKFGLIFEQNDETTQLMKNLGFDLEMYYGPDHENRLPIPATFIIDKDGKVAFSYVNPNYRIRVEPTQVLEDLKTL
ncbi:MAG: peroxiredoxin-like family protein [Cyclobacteriaceae bacterium]